MIAAAIRNSSDLIEFVRSRSAIVEPLYTTFMKTGLSVTEWLRWADLNDPKRDNSDEEGYVWGGRKVTSSCFVVDRRNAPEGGYRRVYTAAGRTRYYRTLQAAEKVALKLNR